MALQGEVSLVDALLRLFLVLLVWGAIVSAAAVWAQRQYGSRVVWLGLAAAVLILTVAGTVGFHRSFPGAESPVITVVMIGLFIGVPVGAVGVAATKGARRRPPLSFVGHAFRAWIAFLASLPAAFVLGALPDIARAF